MFLRVFMANGILFGLLNMMNLVEKILNLRRRCPEGESLDACPFEEIRHLSFKEMVDYINALSDTDRLRFIKHHGECLSNRKSLIRNSA